jgi:hypothetical protein
LEHRLGEEGREGYEQSDQLAGHREAFTDLFLVAIVSGSIIKIVKIPAASSGAFRRKLSVMLGESVPQTP